MILHVEELRAELVETSPEIALVIGGQLVFVVNPNLVEHSSEIDNAADLCRWAANAQLTHRSSNLKICAIPSSFFLSPYAPETAEASLPTMHQTDKAHRLALRELNRGKRIVRDPVRADRVEKLRSNFRSLPPAPVCEDMHIGVQNEGVANLHCAHVMNRQPNRLHGLIAQAQIGNLIRTGASIYHVDGNKPAAGLSH